jgi:uncharacterized protein (DUF486 family)
MSFAWLGHMRFREKGYLVALLVSWVIVLPEYMLNIFAFRWGHGTYEPSAIAAINLCSGVVCVALVSKLFLKEQLNPRQLYGFCLMAVGVVLVAI